MPAARSFPGPSPTAASVSATACSRWQWILAARLSLSANGCGWKSGARTSTGARLVLHSGAASGGLVHTDCDVCRVTANATNLTGTIVSANLPNGLGGSGNTASGLNSTVSGGGGNQVDAGHPPIPPLGAGNANSISGTVDATIGGGYQNNINNVGGYGTIGGGNNNFIASTLDGTIAVGYHNMIT